MLLPGVQDSPDHYFQDCTSEREAQKVPRSKKSAIFQVTNINRGSLRSLRLVKT